MYESPNAVPLMQEAGFGTVNAAANVAVETAFFTYAGTSFVVVANVAVWANGIIATMVLAALAIVKIPGVL